MRTAKFNVGDVIVSLPVEYLDQQTCSSSVFDNVPIESVDLDALIEANKENRGVEWFKYGIRKELLQVTVPTELIEWEA